MWAVIAALLEEARPELTKALREAAPEEWSTFAAVEPGSEEEQMALTHLAAAVPSLQDFVKNRAMAAPALRLLAEVPGSVEAGRAFVELVDAYPAMQRAAGRRPPTGNKPKTEPSTSNVVAPGSSTPSWLPKYGR